MSNTKINALLGNGKAMSVNQGTTNFWLIQTLGIVIGDFADI